MKYTFNFLLCTFLCFSFVAEAQITTPPSGGNQKTVIKQYIGAIATVTIDYNSPDVTSPSGEDRTGKIWGQLEPYGMNDLGFGLRNPSPWRAGANENTTITFSHDMLIQGQAISAGKYGFFVVIEETGPWTIILSKNSDAWGSYFYDVKDDILRVEAIPEESEFHEWLTYEFTDRQEDSATCALMWENKKLPFTVSLANRHDLYLEKIRSDLQGSTGFQWQSWNQAAAYCLNNDVNLEEGLKWADYSISGAFVGQENFTTLSTKAGLLTKLKRSEEAVGMLNSAIEHPTASILQVHGVGRNMIARGMNDSALQIFKKNHERFKGAWPTNWGLARVHSALGNYKEALKYAEMALPLAPDQLNKDNITSSILKLKEGKDIN